MKTITAEEQYELGQRIEASLTARRLLIRPEEFSETIQVYTKTHWGELGEIIFDGVHAWDTLYIAMQPVANDVVKRMVRAGTWRDELSSAVPVRIGYALQRWDYRQGPASAYVVQAVHHECTNLLQQLSRTHDRETFLDYNANDRVEAQQSRQALETDWAIVREAVTNLPNQQRKVVELVYGITGPGSQDARLTHALVGEVLGISERTVRRYLQAAHTNLRNTLHTQLTYPSETPTTQSITPPLPDLTGERYTLPIQDAISVPIYQPPSTAIAQDQGRTLSR
jgi:RNA polymerase sigma factor (sigma-70 family)